MAAAAVGGEAALASSSQTRAGAAVPRERGQAPSPGVARRRIAVLAIVGVVIAAAIGFLIAPSSKKSTPSAASFVGSISSGPLQVSLPAGWSRGTVVGKNLGLSNEFAAEASAAGGAGTLVMGSATTSSPTLLPAKVLSSLGSVPTPQTVTLGKNQFLRYLNVTPKGGSAQTVYAIPTTAGTVVAFCQPQGASTAFASNCERVVGSLQLSSGSIRGLGPDSSYGSKLSAAIGKLNSQQASASSQLAKATKPGDQAKAAAALAAAYHQAATAVKHLQAGTATTTNAAIAASLGKTGDGYAALQQAAAHNDGKGYSSASHQISSSLSDLSSQMGQLAKLGYTAS
jgi:hypothetical protein